VKHRMTGIRAVVLGGILLGRAPRSLALAAGDRARWMIWMPWPWSTIGWVMADRDRIIGGPVPGAWELVELRRAPAAIVRTLEPAIRRWRALARGRWVDPQSKR
jgi:hypothetical protein